MNKFLFEAKLLLKQNWAWCYSVIVYWALSSIAYWLLVDIYKWQSIGPTIVWLMAATNILISLQSAFIIDIENDAISQKCIKDFPLLEFLIYRLIWTYIFTVIPVALGSFLLGFTLHLPILYSSSFFITLLLATWLMVGLGLIISILSKALRSMSNLLILIVLPLYIPIILIGAGSIYHVQNHMSNLFETNMLLGLSLIGCVIFPYLLKAAVTVGVEQQ